MCRAVLIVAGVLLGGCAAPRSQGPYAPRSEAERRPSEAEQLTLRAAELMKSDPAGAEAMLRRALECDVFNGPAHNNLGVLYLRRGEIYPAATEFEWARKLIPGHPDPRVNLALALERAGHNQEACEAYAAALEVMPEYVPAMQGLTCLEARLGRDDPAFGDRLKVIAMRGESDRWRNWARGELARRGAEPGDVAHEP